MEELADSLRTRRQMLSPCNPKLALSLNMIGNAHFRRAEYSCAIDAYTEALESCKMFHGPHHLTIAATLVNLGMVHLTNGDLDHSTVFMEEALAMHEHLADQNSNNLELSGMLYHIGMLYCLKEDFQVAFSYLERSLKARRHTFGNSHLETARTLDALGNVYLKCNEPVMALKYHTSALKTKRALLGQNHASVVSSLMGIGHVHRYKQASKQAVSFYQEAQQVRTATKPKDARTRQEIADAHHLIGLVYMEDNNMYNALTSLTNAKLMYQEIDLRNEEPCMSTLMKKIITVKKNLRGTRGHSCCY